MPSVRSRRRQQPWHDLIRNWDVSENLRERRREGNRSRFSQKPPPMPPNSGHQNAPDSRRQLSLYSGLGHHMPPAAARDESKISGTTALSARIRKLQPAS